MKDLTERQENILEKIVEEYIDSAQPISSNELSKKHDFGIKPAMLRIEMERLENGGFLLQPFVSSGRVPTDKAYRFFVDRIMESGVPEFKGIKTMETLMDEEGGDLFKFAFETVRFLARSSCSVALFSLPEKQVFLKDGWEQVLKEPEFQDHAFFSGFADFLDGFEQDCQNLKMTEGINVFIGKENPMAKIDNFSLISSECRLPNGKKGVFSLAGPKRMLYKRNISLVDSLTKLLEEF